MSNDSKVFHSLNHNHIINQIFYDTWKMNQDNISRTKAYDIFFKQYPEVKWAYLASMVSRNAGWNMCDLEGSILKSMLSQEYRKALFLTYETANYLIFQDAFPQLLLYHYSTKLKRNLFQYFEVFSITNFMRKEWDYFCRYGNEDRLMTSLIINEQNIIQTPVIEGRFFHDKVFSSAIFILQDFMHFNSVVFPTLNGELYGASVSHFKSLDARIQLGKRLAQILFSEQYFLFRTFANKVEHTGSREDYEKYLKRKMNHRTPYLRMTFPLIKHPVYMYQSWENLRKVKNTWRKPIKRNESNNITKWYINKQSQLQMFASIYHALL
ncbi:MULTISPECIES: DUF2515 family protein [Bacillus]|uniref:DUF2515 family protein n=1 Tax=Bacillus TaxID=1386 RepID=UPI0002EE9381|nr:MULTISPECIES: DUF2515 family protein [Bacillus]